MAKKLNKNVVGALTAFAFLAATVLGVIMVKSLQQTDPTRYVELAQQCAAQNQWVQAKNYYLRAYQISQNPVHLVHAGQMLYDSGDEIMAERYWNEAVTVMPTLVDAHERIVKLRTEVALTYRTAAAWRPVRERATKLLEVAPDNARGLYALGMAQVEISAVQTDAAIKSEMLQNGLDHITQATQAAPNEIDYALALATYNVHAGKLEEAEGIFSRLVAERPGAGADSARVRVAYATYLSAQGRYPEAAGQFDAAEVLAGDDPEVRAGVKSDHAQFWLRQWMEQSRLGFAEEAAPTLQTAMDLLRASIDLDESAFLPYLMLAELYSAQGDHLQAIQTCEQRIRQPIRREGIQARQSKYSMYLILIQAGEECLAHAAALGMNHAEFAGMVEKAEGFARDAAAEFADRGPGLHLQAKIKLARGDELAAIEFLQRAAQAFEAPNWRNGKLLAELLMRSNNPGAALQAASDALRDPTADDSCWLTYAQISLAMRDFAQAVRAVDEVLSRDAGNQEALRIKAAALAQLGETQHARQLLDSLSDSSQDRMLRARMLEDEERWSQAADVLATILEREPAHLPALRMAQRVLTPAGRGDQLTEWIARALQTAPDDVALRLLAVEVEPGLTDELRATRQRQILESISEPIERHFRLALWCQQQNKQDEYLELLLKIEQLVDAADSPIDLATRRQYLREVEERLFVYAGFRKDWDRVEKCVEQAVKSNLDGADGLIYRGRAHMLRGDVEQAIASLKAAVAKQPTDASALTLVGQCHMAQDPPQLFEAQQHFERAVEANPNMGAAQKGLADIALRQGDETEFARRIQECARLLPDDPWVRAQTLALKEKDSPAEGIERRLKIRQAEPENVENLVRLGQLYVRTNALDKAQECFEAALAVPDQGDRAVSVATAFYRATQRPQRALEILTDCLQRAADDERRISYHVQIAKHWAELGDMAQAEEALRQAAQVGETLQVCIAFAELKTHLGETTQALEWYDRAVDMADRDSPGLAARLRRSRIDLLLKSADFDRAQREINDYIARYPDDPEGLILQTAANSVRGDIDAAVDNLTQYLESRSSNKHALFQRARLYASQGRRQLAVADLEALRGLDAKYLNYEPRILLADMYSLTGQFDLAVGELESVLRGDPDAKDVAVHLVNLYRARQRHGDAIRICTRLANMYADEPVWLKTRGDIKLQTSGPRDALPDFEAAARIAQYQAQYTVAVLQSMAQLGQFQQGLDYYQNTIPAIERHPRVTARYAELLARAGQVDDAVDQFLQASHAAGYTDVPLLQELATTLMDVFGGERALELFRAAPRQPQWQRDARHVESILLTRLKRTSEALAVNASLLDTAENDAERAMLLAARGNLFESLEQWDDARNVYESLLKTDDRNVIGLNNLAYLLTDKLHRPADAVPYARRAAQLSANPTVLDTLAWTHVELGNYRDAIAILTQILDANPTFVIGLYHLAEAYRRNGDFAKADSVLAGAENLISEGMGREMAEVIKQCRDNITSKNSKPL